MLRTMTLRWALSMAFAALMSVATASADPVTIVGGTIFYSQSNTATFNLTLTRGSLAGEFGSFRDESWTPGHACFGCTPGSTIDPSLQESFPRSDVGDEGSLGGTFVWDTVTYNLTGLTFEINADPVTVPPLAAGMGASNMAQFSLRGLATGTRPNGGVGLALLGYGKARIFFQSNNWFATEFTFEDPAAVPEPATLMLFGTGAAVALARRRRQTA